MSKSKETKIEHHQFKFVNLGTYYVCIEMDGDFPFYRLTLDMLLQCLRFSIPETITYCLADNGQYEMKYRKHGKYVEIYLRERL